MSQGSEIRREVRRFAEDVGDAGKITTAYQLASLGDAFAKIEEGSPGLGVATIQAFREILGISVPPINIVRFSPETRKALRASGRNIYPLTGSTIVDIRKQGMRVFMSSGMESVAGLTTTPSMRCEVAVHPDVYIFPKTQNMDAARQEDELARYSAKVASEFSGSQVTKGEAIDHVELNKIQLGRGHAFLYSHRLIWAQTLTAGFHDTQAVVGVAGFREGQPTISINPLNASMFDRPIIGLAPLIVPAGYDLNAPRR